MLSYRHGFHAGNQADVFKHSALFAFLNLYTQKRKPFTAFDLNAGGAVYNLLSDWSLQTGEAEKGIIRILDLYEKQKLPNQIPEDFKNYLDFCLKNYKDQHSYYGSPEIIRSFLTKDSNLILCDLHSAEAERLKNLYKRSENTHVHKRDCYEAIKALSPPQPARGFALFDPSYEVDSDYTGITDAVKLVLKKWPIGIFLIWYPILNRRKQQTETLKLLIKEFSKNKVLNIEVTHSLDKPSDEDFGLQGSGLLITNPPWGLGDRLNSLCEYIQKI